VAVSGVASALAGIITVSIIASSVRSTEKGRQDLRIEVDGIMIDLADVVGERASRLIAEAISRNKNAPPAGLESRR
jgi:hypothetical protein